MAVNDFPGCNLPTRPIRRFESLSAFVAFGEGPDQAPEYRRASRERSDRRDSWTGSESWEDAVTLAFGGWKEGADKVQRRRAAISALAETGGHTVVMDKRGPGSLSMSRYLSGHPRPYVKMVETEGPKPIIRILVNICVSSAVDPETIVRRGAAVCSLIDAVERHGRTVELETVSHHGFSTYYAVIKRAGQKLNLPSVAFALAHPSMLRRISFGAVEQETGRVADDLRKRSGYGKVGDLPARELPDDVLYLGVTVGRGEQWETDELAAEWVRTTAAAFGVELS